MQLPMFITATHIAALLELRDADAFLAKRAALVADHQFPEPMPTSLRPLRWRTDQVTAWVARQGLPRPDAPPAAPVRSNVVMLHRAGTA
jgi:predicted DNA-binding transcriptional regulator AlpA